LGLCHQVGFDPSMAASVIRKVKFEEPSAGGGASATIPRLDLATALERDCLARMGSSEGKTAWQARKQAIEEASYWLSLGGVQSCRRVADWPDGVISSGGGGV
jgi:hypothetical protein